ncbi:IS21 family transposase [Streptomyces sp. NBC_01236]|uniref:IS21 family transposase n=1 Tax=Streptomyces sp. NBC_01236 TaxID=2903789 RepID=UPI002E0F114D|nr:IS21 family transposase [Streptomyces sp. NBC_01236]
MRPKSKVDLFAAIRRDSRTEGLSIRALARKYDVHRGTVREALSSAWPAPRRKPPPRSSRLDPFKRVIDQMLKADLDAPHKQRHTVQRIYDRLVDEFGMEGISYSLVREYVARRRPQIRVEEGRGPAQVFIPQTHRPGVEAEVDFGDVWVKLRGQPTKCTLFTFRMSFSGKAVHRVFASEGQEAFLEGHVHALRVLGVPTGKVRYDNLSSAVARVLGFTRARVETERWTAFHSHIEVLLLHRHMTHEHVVSGIATALQAGALTADAVALEARKAADADHAHTAEPEPGDLKPSPVASLTARRLARLPADTRPLPSLAAYDALLRHRPAPARPEGEAP